MASLPTNFSVSSTRKTPIPNPQPAQDSAITLPSEDAAFLSGASAYTSKNTSNTDAPVVIGSESAPSTDSAVIIAPESVPGQDLAIIYSSLTQPSVETASAYTVINQPGIATPTASTAEAEPVIATASALTPSVTDDVTPPFPLNHARILYDNYLQTNDSVTSSAGSSTPERALIPNTFERWSFNSGLDQTLTIEISSNRNIDTFCVGAHNLYENGIASGLIIEYSTTTGGAWVEVYNNVPDSQAPIMVHLSSPVSIRRVRFTYKASSARDKYIGYVSAGEALQMQRPFFNGHTPITDADVTRYFHNETESGEIIGQAIRSQGYRTSYEWQNLNDNWYRTYFAPFKQAIKLNPFFIAWNLDEYPLDVGFGRVAQDISAPMQNGGGIRRSVSFELLGHG